MALKDYLKDLTTYVASAGFFDKIKITATGKEIAVEAMEKEKEVILKGKFSKPLAELEGEFGLSNLSLLQTICSDPEFNLKESTVTVVYETKNAERVPTELAYENKSKSTINYRFMSKQLVPDQPKFLEPKWDVVITPTKSSVQQFAWAATAWHPMSSISFQRSSTAISSSLSGRMTLLPKGAVSCLPGSGPKRLTASTSGRSSRSWAC
jgi:hypothetical protein